MKRIYLFILLLFLTLPLQAEWKTLKNGFDYRRIDQPRTHLFRIDPKKWRVDLLLASDYGPVSMTARRYQERSGALLVINGGFFDEFYRSLGLLVRQGRLLNPIRETSWGIFLLKGGEREASILSRRDWQSADLPSTTLAIQAGPRLVIDGKIPSFKESGPTRRSAVGITRQGMVMIALMEGAVSLKEWAGILVQECPWALNLDGGGSSQIAVKTGSFSLNGEGLTAVPNAIGVFGR